MQLSYAKLGQKALAGKVDILSCLTNRRILFAVLGQRFLPCNDGNHNGRPLPRQPLYSPSTSPPLELEEDRSGEGRKAGGQDAGRSASRTQSFAAGQILSQPGGRCGCAGRKIVCMRYAEHRTAIEKSSTCTDGAGGNFLPLASGGATRRKGRRPKRRREGRAHPCFRPYIHFSTSGYIGQHSNLHTVPAVLLCVS